MELQKINENLLMEKIEQELKSKNILKSDDKLSVDIRGRNNFTLVSLESNLFIKIYPSGNINKSYYLKIYSIFSDLSKVPKLKKVHSIKFQGEYYLIFAYDFLSLKNLNEIKINTSLLDSFVNLLVRIHESGLFLRLDKKDVMYDWEKYLIKWCKLEDYHNRLDYSKLNELQQKLTSYLNCNISKFKEIRKSLIHGDINLENFLIDKNEKKVEYCLDLDYACVADPAWEFASAVADWSFSDKRYKKILRKYMKRRSLSDSEKEDFLKRVKFYGPIKKLVILLRIGDISGLDFNNEIRMISRELDINISF